MKKIIPKLYLICIVAGMLIAGLATLSKNNNYIGNMWDTTEEPIAPVSDAQESKYTRQYIFDTSNFSEGRTCLFFVLRI